MLIGGLQKTTLIDFPGRVACTVFTVGCNWHCPFCHNKDLVSLDNFKDSGLKELNEKSFFEFLEKRKKILDGVCITGGEPTLQNDLQKFCEKIKALGLEVKLDTNGSRPNVIKNLVKKGLIDFIAMDVKAAFDEYEKAIGIRNQLSGIKESIKIILQSGIEYELRTTVVPMIHNKETMIKLAEQLKQLTNYPRTLKPIKLNYILQNFRPQNCLDPKYLKIKPYSFKQMQDILQSVQQILPKTKLKGQE